MFATFIKSCIRVFSQKVFTLIAIGTLLRCIHFVHIQPLHFTLELANVVVGGQEVREILTVRWSVLRTVDPTSLLGNLLALTQIKHEFTVIVRGLFVVQNVLYIRYVPEVEVSNTFVALLVLFVQLFMHRTRGRQLLLFEL